VWTDGCRIPEYNVGCTDTHESSVAMHWRRLQTDGFANQHKKLDAERLEDRFCESENTKAEPTTREQIFNQLNSLMSHKVLVPMDSGWRRCCPEHIALPP
jgi:hypothetical protein